MDQSTRAESSMGVYGNWAAAMQGQTQSSFQALPSSMHADPNASSSSAHVLPHAIAPAQTFSSAVPALQVVHAPSASPMMVPPSAPALAFSFPMYGSPNPMLNYPFYGLSSSPLCTYPGPTTSTTTWFVPSSATHPTAAGAFATSNVSAFGQNPLQQPLVTIAATCAASQTTDQAAPFSSFPGVAAAAAAAAAAAQRPSGLSYFPQAALPQPFQPLSAVAIPAVNLGSPQSVGTSTLSATPSPFTVSATPPPMSKYAHGSAVSSATSRPDLELLSPQSTHSSQSDLVLFPATGATPTSVTDPELPHHRHEVKLSHPQKTRKQRQLHAMSSPECSEPDESDQSDPDADADADADPDDDDYGSPSAPRRNASAASSPTSAAPFVCACGRVYQTKSCLTRHKRTSCGASGSCLSPSSSAIGKAGKPYACRFKGCDKRFADISNAKRHELTHIRFKPFRCPVNGCAQHVSRKQALLLHLFKIHSITSGPIYESASQQAPVSSIDELLESQSLPDGFDMTKPIRVKDGSPRR